MRKLCFVLPTFRLGGTEKQVVALSQGLRSRYKIFFLCLKEAGDLAQVAGSDVSGVFEAGMKGFQDIAVVFRAASILKKIQPHIVHTFLFDANIWGILAARWAGIPVRVSGRRSVDSWQGKRHILLERLSNRFVDAITVNAKAVALFTREQEGVPAEKLRLIYNGVDVRQFAPSEKRVSSPWFPDPSSVIVGVVATLFDEKRHDLFLEAAKIAKKDCPGCRFLIVGDGPLRDRLRSSVSAMGLGDVVVLTGELKDPREAYRHMDVSVLCSDREGFSNTVLESMACGLPVIATDAGGNAEAVVDGKTGFIVKRGDAQALGQALLRLVRDPHLRKAMGGEARKRVVEEFSMEKTIQEHLSLYEELLGQKQIPSLAKEGGDQNE